VSEITGAMKDQIANLLREQASKNGMDPNSIDPEKIQVKSEGSRIDVEYSGVKVSAPAPSQEAVDSWFKENGKQFAGALIALVAFGVGAAIARR
jgi:hypothetical protein